MTPEEELANWMHDTMNRLVLADARLGSASELKPLNELAPVRQARYLAVAREMLANPPAVLVAACEGRPVYVERTK